MTTDSQTKQIFDWSGNTRSKKTLIERFEEKIFPEPNTGCWLWGGYAQLGYGTFGIGNQISRLAHRVSFNLYRGEIPKGKKVCHSCDVTSCVNPDHLFLGTQKQNVHDMLSKGRGFKGACKLKIKREQVLEIRSLKGLGMTHSKIAAMFGVSRPTISLIMSGKTRIDF